MSTTEKARPRAPSEEAVVALERRISNALSCGAYHDALKMAGAARQFFYGRVFTLVAVAEVHQWVKNIFELDPQLTIFTVAVAIDGSVENLSFVFDDIDRSDTEQQELIDKIFDRLLTPGRAMLLHLIGGGGEMSYTREDDASDPAMILEVAGIRVDATDPPDEPEKADERWMDADKPKIATPVVPRRIRRAPTIIDDQWSTADISQIVAEPMPAPVFERVNPQPPTNTSPLPRSVAARTQEWAAVFRA